MKTIFDKYESNNIKSVLEEDIVENYIKKYDANEYEKYLKDSDEYEKIQSLLSNRENSINWYNFEKDSKVLELDAGFGEITGSISSKVKEVVCVEPSRYKAEAISIRYKKRQNITVIAANNIDEVELQEKFDYIIIKDKLECLENVQRFLKENGTILLFLNNKFGVSNLEKQRENTITITDIENKLVGKNYRIFYPLPNYYNVNAIFSDKYIPKYNNTKIMNNSIVNNEDELGIDELKLLKYATKEGLFKYFTNSYIIEINPKSIEKFIGFNNARKADFRLCTKIYDEYVIKESILPNSKKHIYNIKKNAQELSNLGFEVIDEFKENDTIYSKYINSNSFNQVLVDEIMSENIESALKLIKKWYEEIKDKLENERIEENKEFSDKLFYVKKLYLDLVFENTFYIDGKFVFYDQEWCLENLPLEFIIYRSINNMYIYNSEISNKIKIDEMYRKLNISEYIEYFKQIEQEFQDYVIDSQIMKLYKPKNKFEYYNNKLLEAKEEISKQILELDKCRGELGLYKAENTKKENYIEEIKSELSEKTNKVEELLQKQKELEEDIKQKDALIDDFENRRFFKILKGLNKKLL